MKDILKKIEQHPYIWLASFIILSGLVLYSQFIFGDYTFVYRDWGSDTKNSYLPIYEYYVQKVSEFRMGDYDFVIGLGTSTFALIQYVTEPFGMLIVLLGVVLGVEKLVNIIIYVQLLKSVLVGWIGLHYLKMFDISKIAQMISAYVLAFSGYIMITGQHYHFASYAVVFFFTVLMCEKTIRNERWWPGVVSGVAILGISGPYPLFQSLIGLGIYSLIRVFQLNEWKRAVRNFAMLIGGMFLGSLISMWAFLPQCYEILFVSKRVGTSTTLSQLVLKLFTVMDNGFLISGFMRLFSNNLQGLINSWEGIGVYFQSTPYFFSLFFPFCIVHEVMNCFDNERTKKDKMMRIVIVILMAFTFFFWGFSLLSNLFAYPAQRFAFVLLPIFTISMGETIDDIFEKKKYNLMMYMFGAMCCIMLLLKLFSSENRYSIISLKVTFIVFIVILVVLILLKYFDEGIIRECLKTVVIICIGFSLLFDSWIALYIDREILSKNEYVNEYQMPYFDSFKSIIDEGDNFIRVDRTFLGYDKSPDMMFSYVHPMRPVSIYNSTLSKYTIESIEKIFGKQVVTQAAYSIYSYGAHFDSHIADLLGLKYVVGYHGHPHDGWVVVDEFNGYYLYRNSALQSAGLIYESYVTQEKYEQMSPEERVAISSQAVILEGGLSGLNESQDINYYELPKMVDSVEMVNGSIEIVIKEMEEAQRRYFLSLEGKGKGTVILQNEYQEVLDNYSIDLDETKTTALPITSEMSKIIVTSVEPEIHVENISVYASDYKYDRMLGAINSKMGNTVECIIDVDEVKLLYMPIGYDANWHVYINGNETELLRANYGFCAVMLQPGMNEVQFVYENKSQTIGVVLSALGIIIFIGSLVYERRNKNGTNEK